MTCCYCGGDMVESTNSYFEELENSFVIVKNVPCHRCEQCGEVVYNAVVVRRLEEITKQLEKALEEVNVVTYTAA